MNETYVEEILEISVKPGSLRVWQENPALMHTRETGALIDGRLSEAPRMMLEYSVNERTFQFPDVKGIDALIRIMAEHAFDISESIRQIPDDFAYMFVVLHGMGEPLCDPLQLNDIKHPAIQDSLSDCLLHIEGDNLVFGARYIEGACERIWKVHWDMNSLEFTCERLLSEGDCEWEPRI